MQRTPRNRPCRGLGAQHLQLAFDRSAAIGELNQQRGRPGQLHSESLGEFRSGLVRDLLDLFGGSPRLLVSNLLETGTITLKDLKDLQGALPKKTARKREGKGHA